VGRANMGILGTKNEKGFLVKFVLFILLVLSNSCSIQNTKSELVGALCRKDQARIALIFAGISRNAEFSNNEFGRWKIPVINTELQFVDSAMVEDSTVFYFNFFDRGRQAIAHHFGIVIFDNDLNTVVFANPGLDFWEGVIKRPSFEEFTIANPELGSFSKEKQKWEYDRTLRFMGFDFDYTSSFMEFKCWLQDRIHSGNYLAFWKAIHSITTNCTAEKGEQRGSKQ
jgi:hypothetical protein